MSEVTEYRDSQNQHRIIVKATNGNKTYSSTEGYKNLKDARNTAINTSIQILEHYAPKLSESQHQKVEALTYLILNND